MDRPPAIPLILLSIVLLAACSPRATLTLAPGGASSPSTTAIVASGTSPTWTATVMPSDTTQVTRHPSPCPSPPPTVNTIQSPAATPTVEPGAPTKAPSIRPPATPSPVSSPVTPPPTAPPLPPGTVNLLPNPSFEEGWYNMNGIPELQVANRWTIDWEEGVNPLDPDPWNVFVRPEARVLSREFIPPYEHDLFIWHGDYTVKVFKGSGAISVRFWTSTALEPGRYRFQVQVFPDLVVAYSADGDKVWAPDPLSGEVQLFTSEGATNWIFPVFGARNSFGYEFTLNQGGIIRLGVALRGRWAIMNNGWFLDDFSLVRQPG